MSEISRGGRSPASHARSLAGVALLLVLAACGKGGAPAPGAPPVSVAAVVSREVQDWDDFTGRLEAVQKVELRPRVSGYIERVTFQEGKEVHAGDLLFVIDPRPYQAVLARAEAELERARTGAGLAASEVTRAQGMATSQAISREELDQRTAAQSDAEAGIRAAEAAVEAAKLDVGFTAVRSPINGRVGRAEVTAGNLVSGTSLLTTVVSLDPIYVYFDGDEAAYLKYGKLAREGSRPSSRDVHNPVLMGLADETGYPHRGVMDFVDNALDPSTGTIRARAVFSNRERIFTPGLFARLRLLGSGKYQAIMIQDKAIGTDQDRKFVYLLGKDSTVQYRAVQLGRVTDGLRVVKGGLVPGEVIVVNGLQRVRPGGKVTPTMVPMAEDSATAVRTDSSRSAS